MVRAVAYAATGVLTAATAWGFLVGEGRRACKCDVPEPPQALLAHGGGLALGALAVIAVLTWVAWRARLTGAILATVGSLLALFGVLGAWLVGGSAADAAARQAQVATVLLGVLLVVRIVVDATVDWCEAAARARGGTLPVGTLRRDR